MPKKVYEGNIVSLKMAKTAVVNVETVKVDKRYKKRRKSNKNFMSHFEDLELGLGDRVSITDSKPYSKNKKWIVEKIIEKAR